MGFEPTFLGKKRILKQMCQFCDKLLTGKSQHIKGSELAISTYQEANEMTIKVLSVIRILAPNDNNTFGSEHHQSKVKNIIIQLMKYIWEPWSSG